MSYIAVTEPQSNPFAPLTSELIKQLRDNPIAIAEGLAGAPRLYLRALEQTVAGDSIRSRRDPQVLVTDTDPDFVALSFGILQTGGIRISGERVGGSGSLIFRRIRNNVTTVLGTFITNAIHTLDTSVLPGDLIEVVYGSPFSGNSTYRNARISTDGQDLWPGKPSPSEGNRNAT